MIYISKSVSKLGGVALSIGVMPKETCRRDAPCMAKCYACKGHYCFKNVKEKLMQNTLSWFDNPVQYEQDIIHACKTCKWFRWFHAGDIIDEDYLEMMYDVAVKVPSTNFLAFTKKYELVNDFIAKYGRPGKNLKIVLSAWGDHFIPENPYHLPVAYVRLKNEQCISIPANAIQCNGNCAECILDGDGGCWTLEDGQSVVFNEH